MKNQALNNCINAFFYLIIFAVVQVVATLACTAILGGMQHLVAASIYSSIIECIIVVALFTWRRWSPPVADYLRQRPWATLLWVAAAAIGAMAMCDTICSKMDLRMDDDVVKLFAGIMNHPLGYIAVGIMAPVTEEVVFRGGILRSLLRAMNGRYHWLAIALSAALFGWVHGNWAQGINAFLLGLMLGWLYYRTDSVVPGIIMHWVNNTIVYILIKLMPGRPDLTIMDLCGGDTRLEIFAVVCALCVLLPSLYQLNMRLHRTNYPLS